MIDVVKQGCVQRTGKREVQTFRTRFQSPFWPVLQAYSEHLGATFTFTFDGNQIADKQTPAGLGMRLDGENVIEAIQMD